MLIERRLQRLYASHHQFYVEAHPNSGDTGSPEFWSVQACQDKLALSDGIVGIGTGSYGYVNVYSEIHDREPSLILSDWDHVTEASLEVSSNVIQIIGCLDFHGETYSITPGSYRVRCCHDDLVKAEEDGDGDDWYVVQIWTASSKAPKVLKQWDDRMKKTAT